MNTYMYSTENNAFIPKQFLDDYVAAGWDLDSLKDVSDDMHEYQVTIRTPSFRCRRSELLAVS